MPKYFIHCDWGTTHFRLRLVRDDGAACGGKVRSDQGVAQIAQRTTADGRSAAFRAVLVEGLRQLGRQHEQPPGPTPVLISGMAGSSIGWQEIPYATVPWRLDGSNMSWRELEPMPSDAAGSDDAAQRVFLLSGIRTSVDVMRGEETEALGLYRLEGVRRLAERSVAILPGTHSKHLRVDDGAIVDFQTFMTGELFEVISRHSVLRHSVADVATADGRLAPAARQAFAAGVRLANELSLSAALFRVRTRDVLAAINAEENRAFLSGLLIGGELAYLARPPHHDVPLVLCAAAATSESYQAACEELELDARLSVVAAVDVERLSSLGQAALLPRLGLA